MPDLIGKSETEAKGILADIGVDDVRTAEVENVAQPGTVLDQVPKEGTTISGPVDLKLAKGLSPMPDWIGKTLAQARPYFDERGVSVTVEEKLEDTIAEGSILSSVPAATETIGAEVKLVVAKRPVTLFIAETTAVERQCSNNSFEFGSGDIAVNGATQQNSVWETGNRYVGAGDSCYEDYDLGRDWETLRGNIGVGDTSNGSTQCQFEIFVDNSPTAVFNQTAGLGMLIPVEIDVTDKLRVRLRVTKVSSTISEFCVWSSLRLIGTGDTN